MGIHLYQVIMYYGIPIQRHIPCLYVQNKSEISFGSLGKLSKQNV